MRNIVIENLIKTPVEKQQVELVERKGRGHPDFICDAIMEDISLNLNKEYLLTFGKILHYNIDKSFLVAGQSTPKIGGGTIDEPMKLIFGDRATYEYQGKKIDIEEIAISAAKRWLKENLRFIDPEKHIIFQNEIKTGSPELTDIFQREKIGANDTSVAVGYAPMSRTEQIVKETEEYINAKEFKKIFPECGEDIKVMGMRKNNSLTLTIAMAFVDRFVKSPQTYFDRKKEISTALLKFVENKRAAFDEIKIDLNTLDDPKRGEGGLYLTVLGTSAEGGDCGQVGRGNKVNGVIALNRPMSTEAAAGKNPIAHVGKIYNILSYHLANKIYSNVSGLQEVYVWLLSQIGAPLDKPLIASAQLVMADDVRVKKVKEDVKKIIDKQLENITEFTDRLARGEFPVC